MAEQKTQQDTPPTNEEKQPESPVKTEPIQKPSENNIVKTEPLPKPIENVHKSTEKVPETTVIVPPSSPENPSGFCSLFSVNKTHPNDLYRRLLPAVLFLMTFVTVMTVLLVYMDSVALEAQQFRLNMSQDYELGRIEQDEPSLVAYVRQFQLIPPVQHASVVPPQPTERVKLLDEIFGSDYTGTFVEMLPSGPQDPTTTYLETMRGWAGIVGRAVARDFLALRGKSRTIHACLSPTTHPREVGYLAGGFRSRVLCLPLYTVLAAADLPTPDFGILGGEHVEGALRGVGGDAPQVIDLRVPNEHKNETTAYLLSQNYSIKAEFTDGIIFVRNGLKPALK